MVESAPPNSIGTIMFWPIMLALCSLSFYKKMTTDLSQLRLRPAPYYIHGAPPATPTPTGTVNFSRVPQDQLFEFYFPDSDDPIPPLYVRMSGMNGERLDFHCIDGKFRLPGWAIDSVMYSANPIPAGAEDDFGRGPSGGR